MANPTTVQHSPRHDGSRLVMAVLVWISVGATFVTTLGIGWLQVYFQLFGEEADRADYTTATGMFAVGAALLLLTPLVAYLLRLGVGSSLAALVSSMVLIALAFDAAHHAAAMNPEPLYDPSWRGGLATIVAIPWMWALPALLIGAVVSRVVGDPYRRTRVI